MQDLNVNKKSTFNEALDIAISVKNFEGIDIAKLVPVGEWALNDNDF